jgi:hypothetical protein
MDQNPLPRTEPVEGNLIADTSSRPGRLYFEVLNTNVCKSHRARSEIDIHSIGCFFFRKKFDSKASPILENVEFRWFLIRDPFQSKE